MFLALILVMVSSTTFAFANTDSYQKGIGTDYDQITLTDSNLSFMTEDSIIGENDTLSNIQSVVEYDATNLNNPIIQPKAYVPNLITLNWTSTENSINFTITNIGDTVDKLTITTKCESGYRSVAIKKLKFGKTNKSISLPLQNCSERVYVSYTGSDGGQSMTGSCDGSRAIPSSLLNKWHKGSFSSNSKSLDYHYAKHKTQLGSDNICQYVRSADSFRGNLNGATKTKVNGSTKAAAKSGKIISYFKK